MMMVMGLYHDSKVVCDDSKVGYKLCIMKSHAEFSEVKTCIPQMWLLRN